MKELLKTPETGNNIAMRTGIPRENPENLVYSVECASSATGGDCSGRIGPCARSLGYRSVYNWKDSPFDVAPVFFQLSNCCFLVFFSIDHADFVILSLEINPFFYSLH